MFFLQNIDLVTVIVLAYNSYNTALATLESIKRQTYPLLELIICDDNSHDKTFELCEEWIENNKNRFVNCELIRNSTNLGTPKNANIGLSKAQGVWVKFIGADDILRKDAIEKYVEYAKRNNYDLVISNFIRFYEDKKVCKLSYNRVYLKSIDLINNKVDNTKKVNEIIKGNFTMPGCVFFFNKKSLSYVGGFDEDFKILEDDPILFKFLLNNYSVGYVNEYLIYYRKNLNSASLNITFRFYHDFITLYEKYKKSLYKNNVLLHLHYLIQKFSYRLCLHLPVLQTWGIFRVLWLLSPLSWRYLFVKIFLKKIVFK
ncbi:MAG: glycosyltransferase [Bacteroidales bacterium]|nr:glycosyltransferase [Bacteroidales bacterium]